MTAVTTRSDFQPALERALRLAARARRQAECLAPDAPRAQRLSVALSLSDAATLLAALRNDIALRLAALRQGAQTNRAYARADRLGTGTRGDRT